MNLKPSSAAKVLLFYGLAVSVLPLVLGIERVCEVWLNIPEIPTEILVVLDGVIKMMIVSTLLPTSWTLLHPFLYLFKREWRNASDALYAWKYHLRYGNSASSVCFDDVAGDAIVIRGSGKAFLKGNQNCVGVKSGTLLKIGRMSDVKVGPRES